MKKNNPSIKDVMTNDDCHIFTKLLASAYYSYDPETDDMKATPDVVDDVMRMLFYQYAVDGIEFETIPNEDGDDTLEEYENPLDVCDNDPEILGIYEDYVNGKYDGKFIARQLSKIMVDAQTIANFEMQKYLNNRHDDLGRLIEGLASLGRVIENTDWTHVNAQMFSDSLARAFANSPSILKLLKEIEAANENQSDKEEATE